MSGEREWVETVKIDVEAELPKDELDVVTGFRLPYAFHIASYPNGGGELSTLKPESVTHEYQTDLLIAEKLRTTKAWVPRVVVEFKLGRVTTHDALTYSTKAATHKNVHPYLRYGIVIGGFKGPLPRRLLRHGQHFDFMATIESETLTVEDRGRLVEVLKSEVQASRTLSSLMAERSDIWLMHRNLEIKSRSSR